MNGTPGRLGAEPMVFVTDLARALAFYEQKLGFAVALTWGNPPFYAQIVRDDARLNLRHVDEPVIDAALRDAEDLLSAVITLDDTAPLFRAYEAAGVPLHQSLRTEPWGARTFIVSDPDGNLILFSGRR